VENFFKKIQVLVRRNGLILVFFISLLAVGLSAYNTYLLKTVKTGPALAPSQNFAKLTPKEVDKLIRAGAPVLGNPEAKVTVVEFADFQCPYCGKYFETVFPEIKKNYIDTGKVKFIYMDFAFLGVESQWAAEAAKCASEQGKFWEYHDHLYENQSGENGGAFSVDNLKKFASDLKLNKGQFAECLDGHKYAKKIEEEKALGQKFGVRGTPGTFINDFFINGLQGVSYFTTKLEAALSGK